MTPEKIQPLYSAFEDDLELEEELSGFVVSLAEDVDLIQDAETAGSLPDVGSRARLLAQRAERFGYRLLTEIASEVVTASDEDKPRSCKRISAPSPTLPAGFVEAIAGRLEPSDEEPE